MTNNMIMLRLVRPASTFSDITLDLCPAINLPCMYVIHRLSDRSLTQPLSGTGPGAQGCSFLITPGRYLIYKE